MARILFLHGYTQSGNTLRHKTGALSKALAKYAEITYPTAPIELAMPDDADINERDRLAALGNELSEGSYAWWLANDTSQDLDGLTGALEFMKNVLERDGPFDGVMGFSQGGGFAAILASLLERRNELLTTTHPPFKFAIIFSGFKSRFSRHDWIYEPMIKTPFLHVIGNVDPIVTPERSQQLIDVCMNSETLYHPDSHFVPSAAPYKSKIVDFVVDKLRPYRGMTCIVAATQQMGIGKDGGLPWKLRKEMKYFADVTTRAPEGKQNVVIMGRRSWESIPQKFRPLKGRINIVVTSKEVDCLSATSLDDALLMIQKKYADTVHRVFVIGGAQLYKSALSHPDTERILFTTINSNFDCDTMFPSFEQFTQRSFDELSKWVDLPIAQTDNENGVEWEYKMFERPRNKL